MARYYFLHCWLAFALIGLASFEEGSDSSPDTAAQVPDRVPSIWAPRNDGGESSTQAEQSYRLKSEIVVTKKKFIVEEWASNLKQAFRMDLIDAGNGKRSSVLVDRKRGEIYHYEPFICLMAKSCSESLWMSNGDLVDKFPELGLDSLAPTGVGSLWLHSLGLKAEFKNFSELASEESFSKMSEVQQRAAIAIRGLVRFNVSATRDFDYNLRFFFGSQQLAQSLSLIQVERNSPKRVTAMRARILELESPMKQQSSDLFHLPVGYGCKRTSDTLSGGPLQPLSEPLPEVLGASGANWCVLGLDIVTIQPVARGGRKTSELLSNCSASAERPEGEEEEKYVDWRSHSSSVRLIAGKLKLGETQLGGGVYRDYLALETQDYSPPAEGRTLGRKLGLRAKSMRRLKRVWELAASGGGGDEDEDSTSGKGDSLSYLEIDELTGECLEQDRGARQSAYLEFPIPTLAGKTNTAIGSTSSPANSHANAGTESGAVSSLTLNAELVEQLFGEASMQGFHFIRRLESPITGDWLVYESRIDSFELRDRRGLTSWSGAVSILRHRKARKTIDDERPPQYGSAAAYKSVRESSRLASASIIFLSSTLSQVVAKVNIDLVELRNISLAHFHRQLSGASAKCYQRQQSAGRRRGKNELSFTYRKEVAKGVEMSREGDSAAAWTANLAASDQLEALIYERFLDLMLTTTVGAKLDPLQLVDVQVKLDKEDRERVNIRATLLNRPSLLSFGNEIRGQRLSARQSSKLVEIKSNSERCAETCLHYNCIAFAYSEENMTCEISLMEDKQEQRQQLEADQKWSLFESLAASRRGADPLQVMHELRRRMQEEPNSLSIKLDEQLQLIPLSAHFGDSPLLGPISAGETLVVGQEESSGGEAERDQLNLLLELPEAEYLLLMPNRRFLLPPKRSESFPIGEAKQISYDDCELLCDEMDCSSFSYCQLAKTCLISQLIKSLAIEESSKPEDLCNLMARDHLSKFQLHPSRVSKFVLRPISGSKYVVAGSNRDCAHQCIEESSFNCGSFYYCPRREKVGSAVDCYLRQGRSLPGDEQTMTRLASERQRLELSDKEHTDTNQSSLEACELYKRSYLSQYDKFYGLSLAEQQVQAAKGQEEQEVVLVPAASGSEQCAAECSERVGQCYAFQLCRHSADGRALRPSCALLLIHQSLAHDDSGSPVRPKLEADENCTAFVLSSSRTGSYKSKSQILSQPIDFERAAAASSPDSSDEFGWRSWARRKWPWLARFLLLLLGLALGYYVTLAALGSGYGSGSR